MKTLLSILLFVCLSFSAKAQTSDTLLFRPYFGENVFYYTLEDDYLYYNVSYTVARDSITEVSSIQDKTGKRVGGYEKTTQYDSAEVAQFFFKHKKEIAKNLF